jgi:hypothetical protein
MSAFLRDRPNDSFSGCLAGRANFVRHLTGAPAVRPPFVHGHFPAGLQGKSKISGKMGLMNNLGKLSFYH